MLVISIRKGWPQIAGSCYPWSRERAPEVKEQTLSLAINHALCRNVARWSHSPGGLELHRKASNITRGSLSFYQNFALCNMTAASSGEAEACTEVICEVVFGPALSLQCIYSKPLSTAVTGLNYWSRICPPWSWWRLWLWLCLVSLLNKPFPMKDKDFILFLYRQFSAQCLP